MAGKVTTDHDEIRRWAEERGGKPGAVRSTERPDDPGILRICFPHAPHHKNEAIEEIGWESFFEKFDEQGLQLVYQDRTAEGQLSDFNKLTYPDPDSPEGKALLRKSAGKKSGVKKSAAKKTAGKSASNSASAKSSAKTAEKKAPAKKSAAKKSASKSASVKSSAERPARNYPKPEHGSGHTQVF